MTSPPATRRALTIGVVTLGCDKNTVDSERYVAELAGHGARYTAALDEADVIVVNTCGFIDAAKQESIDALVEAGQRKAEGACRAVVAVGCMVERHKADLVEALPEVDLFLGASEVHRLVPALVSMGMLDDDDARVYPGERVYTGELPHVRYLKISEGCDHSCAFCAIPLMRGRHRSFAAADVVREAQLLGAQGAREINLVAQDLAHYGRDRRDGVRLPELLESLLGETDVPWYRLLYIYSAGLTPRVLEMMGCEPRLVPYLDVPMQHASDRVLELMRRPERARTIRATLARARAAVPDVAVRTTCIVGFPGETDDDVARLLDFLEEVRFERVGVFTYSAQEGTRAAALPDDVPEEVKLERLERVEALDRAVAWERCEERVGRVVRAIVDRVATGDGPAAREAEGRVIWQADDIDGITRLSVPTAHALAPGALVDVRLDEVVDDFDYRATVVRVREAAPRRVRPSRALPLLTSSTVGSYGR